MHSQRSKHSSPPLPWTLMANYSTLARYLPFDSQVEINGVNGKLGIEREVGGEGAAERSLSASSVR